jgi:hypothetical protein
MLYIGVTGLYTAVILRRAFGGIYYVLFAIELGIHEVSGRER